MIAMKNVPGIITLALTLAVSAGGAPLQRGDIAGDAKWLLHLDVDNLRSTHVGDFIGRQIITPNLITPRAMFQQVLGLDLDWQKISSVTAYGSDYGAKAGERGMLVIKTTMPFGAALEAFTKAHGGGGSGDADGSPVPIERLDSPRLPLYRLHGELLVGAPSPNVILLAKSRELIERAADVIAGKAASVANNKDTTLYDHAPKAFFFFAAAEALNEDTKVPREAEVLKMADGGRVVVGEDAGRLFCNLLLRAKTLQVATQMQQIVQGIVALVTMSQTENKELLQLVQSAKVSSDDRAVTVNLEYPVDQAIERLRHDKIGQKESSDGASEKKAEAETKPKADPTDKSNDK